MSPTALFGILQLDRGEPLTLRWATLSGQAQAWLEDAGGFAAVGLLIYIAYALLTPTDKSESEKLRVPLSGWMVAMAGLAVVGYAVMAACVLMEWNGVREVAVAGRKLALAPPPPPDLPAYAHLQTPRPEFHWDVRHLSLMLAGFFAVLGIGQPFARDVLKLKWRRVGALARLAFKEAVRNRVLWVFLLFFVPFLFPAKWFVAVKGEDELRTTVGILSWVLAGLILTPALLLAAIGLDNDVKRQTIHTVVTKPVERFEIVLGRFLGYTALMTLVLAGLSGVSLVMISAARIDEKAQEETLKARVPVRGALEFKSRKQDFDGTNVGREFEYRKYITGHPLSPQRGIWRFDAVPAALAATDRDTVPVEFTFDIFRMTKGDETGGGTGVTVEIRFCTWQCPQRPPTQAEGGEWKWENTPEKDAYDQAVQNLRQGVVLDATSAAAAENTPRAAVAARLRKLADRLKAAGVPLTDGAGGELRTDPVIPEAASPGNPGWVVVNALAEEFGFYEVRGKEVADYHVMGVAAPAGLFRNARADGHKGGPRFSIYVKCESPGQMLGMAQPDLYLLEANQSFAQNYLKGMFGLWCRLCIIIGLAVALSTYLSGIITVLVAAFIFQSGYATDHINDLAANRSLGGGPVESMKRLLNAEVPTTPLEGTGAEVIRRADSVFGWLFRRFQNVVPDVESFTWTNFVSEGFNVSNEYLVLNVLTMLAYLLPWFVLAYYLMKSREIAA